MKKNTSRVIAIDPGFGRCGVAVLEKASGTHALLYSTCIETPARAPFGERLKTVAETCQKLIAEYAPAHLAIESLFFNSNQKTAFQVAEVRGALLFVAAQSEIEVFEYTPAQVKSATTGWGRADKKAMAQMLHATVHIEKPVTHDDEYDAIAIGVTHLASHREL